MKDVNTQKLIDYNKDYIFNSILKILIECNIKVIEIDYELMKRVILNSISLIAIEESSYEFIKLSKINIEQLNKKYTINDKTNISDIIDYALDKAIINVNKELI
ncbi:hypothetical protein [Brachyspira pilosicoli]|uniref:hypothetical protein n=1 Tax=Brachyspira pilosicoli TaxID=52584 RepID=UPI000C78F136|nr:hypothetical protein [Brachyspira pilosicoli]PLV64638.1 hypothetical protein BPSP16_00720 [Brachyspira pilosicoli SP16]